MMYDVVPGILQRLREADIVTAAGLTVASLGQEYCRAGAVHSMKREGARLSGIVDVPDAVSREAAPPADGVKKTEYAGTGTAPGRYNVEVEIHDDHSWTNTCTCGQESSLCAHAAAVLYQWVTHPQIFTSPSSTPPQLPPLKPAGTNHATLPRPMRNPGAVDLHRTRSDVLAPTGLSELRSIAREYEINVAGLSKQQLADAIAETISQPEAVRRMVATLEKPQRQLLAALTLAGGTMNDEDLRGLCERFSLGKADQVQNMLQALSNKALIVRAHFNNSLQQRIGAGGSSLEMVWHVPEEVRTALHVTLPITPYTVAAGQDPRGDEGKPRPGIQHIELSHLLADLLLVARMLDGYPVEREDKKNGYAGTNSMSRSLQATPSEGSIAIPPPDGQPPASLLEFLQSAVPRSPAFLRFAVRLLRMAEILYRDESATPSLRVLPNAARLLLGPTHTEVAHELFMHWLNRSSYEELFDLQEDGLRVRCRATSLGQPALRPGELEAENSEARRTLIALLGQAPLHQWINFPVFARFVYRLNPAFLQKRQRLFSSPHWWIEQDEGHPLQPVQLNDWLRAEGFYLARLISGPLHWWGIADVALSPEGRLLAFQLTAIARFLLDEAASPSMGTRLSMPESPGEKNVPVLKVSDDGRLFIPCTPANWEVIELVENYAEVKGVYADQLCYQLTSRSLSEALGRGQSPVPLLKLLRSAAEDRRGDPGGRPISSPGDHQGRPYTPYGSLLANLERRMANYGRVRLYTDASLLEAADTQVMRELSAVTSLDEQVVQPVSPTILILKKQGIERLVDELKRRGQVPLVHDEG